MTKSDETEKRQLVTFLTSQLILKASERKLTQFYLFSYSKNPARTNSTVGHTKPTCFPQHK